jgi:hypothetical protein
MSAEELAAVHDSLSAGLVDLVVAGAFRAFTAGADTARTHTTELSEAWLETPRSTESLPPELTASARAAVDDTAAVIVDEVLPMALHACVAALPATARSEWSLGESSAFFSHESLSPSVQDRWNQIPWEPPMWSEIEGIIRSHAQTAVGELMKQFDPMRLLDDTVEEPPDPPTGSAAILAQVEKELYDSQQGATEWRQIVGRLVRALEDGDELMHVDLLLSGPGEAKDAAVALQSGRKKLKATEARLAVETEAYHAAVADMEAKEEEVKEQEKMLEDIEADNEDVRQQYADVLAQARSSTESTGNLVEETSQMDQRADVLKQEIADLTAEIKEANMSHEQLVQEVADADARRQRDADLRTAEVVMAEIRHKQEWYWLDRDIDVERLELFGRQYVELTEGKGEATKAEEHLEDMIREMGEKEKEALAEIAEIERTMQERDREIADVKQKLKAFDGAEMDTLLEFQREINDAKESAKLDLEAHRRVVQQEQIKVSAMQDEIGNFRRARIAEEKLALSLEEPSIALDMSTQKYVFPPIQAGLATANNSQATQLSRTPAEAAFQAWGSSGPKPSDKVNALGKRKMKYLAEVYVPKALQHMDDAADMNKTLPAMGRHLPKTINPELHKTTIGVGKGKKKEKGSDVLLESM